MKKRVLSLVLALCLTAGAALAAGGSDLDPLISLRYLTDTYLPQLLTQAEQRLDAGSGDVYDQAAADLSAPAARFRGSLTSGGSYHEQPTEQRVKAGDSITCPTGSTLLLLAGAARLTGGAAVDASAAEDLSAGADLIQNHRYITPEKGDAVYTVTSDTAVIAPQGYFTLVPSGGFDCNQLADALKALGIFRGTNVTIGSGYHLEAAPTRIQGLIMFLRLLGEEEAALACAEAHPFRDVPDWCAPYVAYAFARGYTNGVDLDAGRFGTNGTLTAAQYVTFILRALGYQDGGDAPDFTWDTALEHCQSIGLLTAGEREKRAGGEFLRALVVYLSYYALSFPRKGDARSLLEQLTDSGALDAAAAREALSTVTSPRIQ